MCRARVMPKEQGVHMLTQGGTEGCLLLELCPLSMRALQSVKIDAIF